MIENNEIIFIYLGKSLPKYANASMALAQKYSGLDVHLIGEKKLLSSISKNQFKFTELEEFYQRNHFQEITGKIIMPHTYRNGFWLKTIERFFVLHQFMKHYKIKSVFHAELDQLLFNCKKLITELGDTGLRGVFFPLNDPNKAVASVFYCNEIDALSDFIEFTKKSSHFENEMKLLAKWAISNPNSVHIIPTLATELNGDHLFKSKGFSVVERNQMSGVVDAAQLGQWIGGQDPRNLVFTEIPKNKFIDSSSPGTLSLEQLSRIKFNFIENQIFLAEINCKPIQIYNLHLHSKIHNWILNRDQKFKKFIHYANQEFPTILPTTRQSQIFYLLKSALGTVITHPFRSTNAIFRRIYFYFNFYFNRRPSSSPYLSGDTFRIYANHIWESTNKKINVKDLKKGDVVFCESDEIETLHDHVLSKLSFPIVLILGNSDRNFFEEVEFLSENSNVSIVFAQNLGNELKKFRPIPIGLENLWRSNNGRVLSFKLLRLFKKSKKNRIMWTFDVGTNLKVRLSAAEILLKIKTGDHLGLLTPRQHRSALSKYSFVASPPGNGLDTHRTWEAMYLRCVPIVLRSYMTEYFADLGLPIWVIDSFEDLEIFDESMLRSKYQEFENKFNSNALWFNFWEKEISSYK